jgi:hypothetical protein
MTFQKIVDKLEFLVMNPSACTIGVKVVLLQPDWG